MARRKTTLSAEAQAKAKEQAAADAALLAAVQERDAAKPPAPPKRTLGDNFIVLAGTIQQAHRDTRLSETTLVKLMELTMMWEINNRNNPRPQPVFDPRELVGGEESNGEPDEGPPEPNERIEAVVETAEETPDAE